MGDALVADIVELTKMARARETGLPVVFSAIVMGSFAVQQYLLNHSDLVAASVLSESASIDKLRIDPSRSFGPRVSLARRERHAGGGHKEVRHRPPAFESLLEN